MARYDVFINPFLGRCGSDDGPQGTFLAGVRQQCLVILKSHVTLLSRQLLGEELGRLAQSVGCQRLQSVRLRSVS